jgi:ankyrin repeat protein
MKSCLTALILFAAASVARAATNDLTSILQQALFEEEANRNLDAAVQAYQSLETQFDQDRQVAATAVFRLGECYRKLGRTNDATLQYQRILHDFSDQGTLVTLSRQNLAGLGSAPIEAAMGGAGGAQGMALSPSARAQQRELLQQEIAIVEKQLADSQQRVKAGVAPTTETQAIERDLIELKQRLVALSVEPQTSAPASNGLSPEAQELQRCENIQAQLQGWDFERLRKLLPTLLPDTRFEKLNFELTSWEDQSRFVGERTKTNETFYASLEHVRDETHARADELMQQLADRIAKLKTEVANHPPTSLAQGGNSASGPVSVVTDEEDQEIRRIQDMIRNSPDLINSPGEGNSETPLLHAVSAGQIRVATFLLDHGAEVEKASRLTDPATAANGRGMMMTPLMAAADNGHKALVELLLSRGARVNGANPLGIMALHLAVERGFAGVVETLLASNADANALCPSFRGIEDYAAGVDGNGNLNGFGGGGFGGGGRQVPGRAAKAALRGGVTPLRIAANQGNVSMAKLLMAKGADVNLTNSVGDSALDQAVVRGHEDMVRALLAAGAKADRADFQGYTPLHLAAREGNVEIVNDLLAQGVPVDAQTVAGATPLFLAVYNNRAPVVATLLEHHADPKIAGRFWQSDGRSSSEPGYTRAFPIFFAIQNQEHDVFDQLLDHGADPEARAEAWEPRPLLQAVRYGDEHVVELLLQNKANPNRIATDDAAPLATAAAFNNQGEPAIVRLLLEHGADPNAHENWEQATVSPLIDVVSRGFVEIARLLLDHHADANARLADGRTALHVAVNQPEMVKLLLDHGADPNLQDNSGRTPLDIAKGRNGPAGVGMPPLSYQWAQSPPGLPPSPPRFAVGSFGAANNPQPAPAPEPPNVATLLRQHGALDDLPKPDVIEVTAPSAKLSFIIFHRSAKDWNHFTLAETLREFYWRSQLETSSGSMFMSRAVDQIPFPDLTRITVIHRSHGATNETRTVVNLSNGNGGIDCAKDVPLDFGDVVEIPERLHALGDHPTGLSTGETAGLEDCLKGNAQLTSNHHILALPLQPGFDRSGIGFVLSRSEVRNLLLSSADLSHVKVTRHDPKTGQTLTWVVDCTGSPNQPDLRLRNGDVIEVPDKS